MFFVNLLQANLKTRLLGNKITYYATTTSTNDDIWSLWKEGAKEGHVVVSDHQTKGRGQRNNTWYSIPGHGILCSFILLEKFSRKLFGMHSILIPIGIIRGIEKLVNINLSVKWPNDIYFKNKKIGGILIESKIQNNKVIFNIGLGINVNENIDDFPNEINNRVASIKSIIQYPIQRELLLANILNSIDSLIHKVDTYQLTKEWNEICINTDTEVLFNYKNKMEKGIFKRINNKGEAIIQYKNNFITYNGIIN